MSTVFGMLAALVMVTVISLSVDLNLIYLYEKVMSKIRRDIIIQLVMIGMAIAYLITKTLVIVSGETFLLYTLYVTIAFALETAVVTIRAKRLERSSS